MKKLFFLFTVFTTTLYSCVKEPSYTALPHIQFVSVSSSYIVNGSTDTITFSFTDGNGNIGPSPLTADTNSNPSCCGDTSCLNLNNFNIFLIDNRYKRCIYPFQSPDLRPAGSYKAISGNMQVLQAVYNLQCPNCDASCPTLDSVIYTIVIKDIAGNFSNKIKTSAIYVTCVPN